MAGEVNVQAGADRTVELGNLALASSHRDQASPAALALIKPAIDTGIRFERAVAEQVAADVDGYPYFIQKYGEALWDAADAANLKSSQLQALCQHPRASSRCA